MSHKRKQQLPSESESESESMSESEQQSTSEESEDDSSSGSNSDSETSNSSSSSSSSDDEDSEAEKLARARRALKARLTAPGTDDQQLTKTRRRYQPLEVSSKVPVSRLGPNSISGITVTKKVIDPRFEETSGPASASAFRRAYGFIDDIKKDEVAVLKKKMKRERDDEAKRLLQSEINQREQDLRRKAQFEQHENMAREFKKRERELVAQGKSPYYLKETAVKQLGAAAKFMELDKAGRVDRFIAKSRTKKAAKDRKYLPGGPGGNKRHRASGGGDYSD